MFRMKPRMKILGILIILRILLQKKTKREPRIKTDEHEKLLTRHSVPSYDSSQGRVARMTFPLRIRLKQNSQNERIY